MSQAGKMRLLMAGTGLLLMAGPAFSLDGADLVAKINAASGLPGNPLAVGTIDVRGATVTLRGTTYKPAPGEAPIPIGDITLDGVEESGGGYFIETVTFPNVDVTEDKTHLSIADISMSNVTIPADVTGNTLASVLLYDEASTGPMTVTVDGKTVISATSASSTTDVSDDMSTVGFAIEVNDIKADLSTVEDAKSRETIEALSLTSIDGNMTMSGNWEVTEGLVDVEEFTFDFANIGTLALAFSFSGYTMDFIAAAQETTQAMEANASQESKDAAGLAMLGLMQRLTFNSAEISFDDAGITNRGLDFAGKQQGISGEQMAQMVKAMTPLMLAQYNVPELQNMVSEAVNTFIDNPGNLVISAQPDKPVPFPMIMGAAMGAPNTLPEVLGITAEANKRR
jgi:hypothetical protein